MSPAHSQEHGSNSVVRGVSKVCVCVRARIGGGAVGHALERNAEESLQTLVQSPQFCLSPSPAPPSFSSVCNVEVDS